MFQNLYTLKKCIYYWHRWKWTIYKIFQSGSVEIFDLRPKPINIERINAVILITYTLRINHLQRLIIVLLNDLIILSEDIQSFQNFKCEIIYW